MDLKRFVIKTLGCKANLCDSQLIEAELVRRGWSVWREDLDRSTVRLCIINSCTVTDEAERQSRKTAARLMRDFPESRVVLTGCSAEIAPEKMSQARGVSYVVGNRDKPRLVDLVLARLESSTVEESYALARVLGDATSYDEMRSQHPLDREWPLPETPDACESRTRAFLKIQEGCNCFCSYCIIPYARGPSRSMTIEEAVSRVRMLCSRGVREIVVTGTDIGDFGSDWADEPQLEALVERLLLKTPLERLRVSSLAPREITPRLLDVMRNDPRFCPHLHVSLQSPHSRILKAMKRGYSWDDVRACLDRIAAVPAPAPAPAGGVFVGMDVIAGFPGETDVEFEESYSALESVPWTRLHVFPYSEREGTPATRIPEVVPRELRVERAERLRALSISRLKTAAEAAWVGGRQEGLPDILLEGFCKPPAGFSGEWISGYTRNYFRVVMPARDLKPNTLVRAHPTGLSLDERSGDVLLLGLSADHNG